MNYVVAIDGGFYLVYGTSASTPVVGAMFALINDARLAEGKGSIGFVNPVLVGFYWFKIRGYLARLLRHTFFFFS